MKRLSRETGCCTVYQLCQKHSVLCTPEFVAMQLCFFKPSKAKRRGRELKALHKEALSRGVGTERP